MSDGVKKGKYSNYEVKYIESKYLQESDTEMAKALGRDPEAITRKRREMGLKKASGRPTKKSKRDYRMLKPESQVDREIYATLTKTEKKELFLEEFKDSERYRQLTEICVEAEISFYSERFLDYIFTFETLLEPEQDTLHLAILELIRSHRILKRQKEIRESLNADEIAHGHGIEMLDKEYKNVVDSYNSLMKALGASRAQRIAKDKEKTFNLVTVVQALQDEENRRRAGEEAAVIEAAKNFVAEDMRKKHYLLD